MLCVAQFFVESNCIVVSGESPQGSVGRFDSKARQCKAKLYWLSWLSSLMMHLKILSLFFIFQGSTGNSTSGAGRVDEGGGRKGIYKGGGWETRFFRHLEKPWSFVIQYLFIPLKYLLFDQQKRSEWFWWTWSWLKQNQTKATVKTSWGLRLTGCSYPGCQGVQRSL